jgi:hypothetical protein
MGIEMISLSADFFLIGMAYRVPDADTRLGPASHDASMNDAAVWAAASISMFGLKMA